MMNRPTFSDVYDINPKTGALILGKNRLDDGQLSFREKSHADADRHGGRDDVRGRRSGEKNHSVAVHEISDAGSDAVCRGALPRTDGTGKLRDRRAFDGVDAGGHGSVFLSGKICLDRAFFRLSAQLYRRGGNRGQPFDAGVCGRRGVQSEYEALVSCDGA